MIPLQDGLSDDDGGITESPIPEVIQRARIRRRWLFVAGLIGAAAGLLLIGAAIGAATTLLAVRSAPDRSSSSSSSTSTTSSSSSSSNSKANKTEGAPNVIYMIGDGTGLQATSLARLFALRRYNGNATKDPLAAIASRPGRWAVSQITTHSSTHLRTDSAAAATALACGHKTYNGAIAVLPVTKLPCTTLFEAAAALGWHTGAVATCSITGATIAAFTAHAESRTLEESIAAQQLSLAGIDVLIGGGSVFFNATSRSDRRDLFSEAAAKGFTVVTDPAALASAVAARPSRLLALLQPGGFPFAIDRQRSASTIPRLAWSLRAAVDILSRHGKPFVLLVEGSNTDIAEHLNDAAATAHEAVEFFEAVTAATDIAEADGNTIVLVVADHDTGGMSLGAGNSGYALDLGPVLHADESTQSMAAKIAGGANATELLLSHGGIIDESLTPSELSLIAAAGTSPSELQSALAKVLSARAGIAWGTMSHAATDVMLYTFVPEQLHNRFSFPNAVLDNTDIPKWVAEIAGLDLGTITANTFFQHQQPSLSGNTDADNAPDRDAHN